VIIDFHTHTFPDALAERALSVLKQNCSESAYTDATCDGLCASMATAKIDISVVQPIATRPKQVASISAWAVQVQQNYDNLICFGSLHPQMEDAAEQIAYLVDHGIRGVKLHPDYQGFFVDDPLAFPLYRALEEAGIVLLLHAGLDIGLPEPVHCTPERLARVLDTFPNLTVVAAHMGGYRRWDEVYQHLCGRDLYFDTSYSFNDMGAQAMKNLVLAHGMDKVLFGTDSPWADQNIEVQAIRSLGLSSEQTEAVFYGNAARLITLP